MMAAIKKGDGRRDETQFVPTEDWIVAFEVQFSERDFGEYAKRYARSRARLVAHAGRNVDELYARELVQDVLDDTLEGVLAWDPARVSLKKHVLDAIKSRTRHDYVQALRFKHESFDTNVPSATLLAAETALGEQQVEQAQLVEAAAAVVDALRSIAAQDPDVLVLIDAYSQDATKKIDVMRVTGFSSKRYEAARKRMRRLVRQLPEELHHALTGRD